MSVNRGKQFESVIRKQFEESDFCIDRIQDTMSGFAGAANICDFMVYNKPYLMYLECKTTHNASFPLTNLSQKQFDGMDSKVIHEGVIAGVMIWFIDYNITMFVPIQQIVKLKGRGCKSISVKRLQELDDNYVTLNGYKKSNAVFFKYDLEQFWDDVVKLEGKL